MKKKLIVFGRQNSHANYEIQELIPQLFLHATVRHPLSFKEFLYILRGLATDYPRHYNNCHGLLMFGHRLNLVPDDPPCPQLISILLKVPIKPWTAQFKQTSIILNQTRDPRFLSNFNLHSMFSVFTFFRIYYKVRKIY